MTEPPKAAAKIGALEGLRGAMCWWVLFGHASLAFGWNLPLIEQNHLAVDVFIILSGYVISRLILRKQEPYGVYITRRACRIFPLYLAALAASTLLLPVQLGAWAAVADQTAANANRLALVETALANLPAHLAAHIPLAQGLIPNTVLAQSAYTLIGQAWSVSLEWQFYLVAPVLVWSLIDWRRLPVAGGIAVLLWFAAPHFSEAFLGAKLALFLIGICSYFAVEYGKRARVWIVASLAAAVVAALQDGPMLIIALVIWGTTLISVTAPQDSAAHLPAKFLGTRQATHFGEVSYSLYLVHMIPLYTSIYVLTRIGLSGILMELAAFAVTVAGSYWLARATYAWIERPGIDFGARITHRAPNRRELAQSAAK
jgi:peptidoglycan/LPS O-acetylase OafA/YrhL